MSQGKQNAHPTPQPLLPFFSLKKLSFVERHFLDFFKVPTLMKATADDENPCPGYLFQEIGSIHISAASFIEEILHIHYYDIIRNSFVPGF